MFQVTNALAPRVVEVKLRKLNNSMVGKNSINKKFAKNELFLMFCNTVFFYPLTKESKPGSLMMMLGNCTLKSQHICSGKRKHQTYSLVLEYERM
jgi:hypothetical protein